jgi:hypothetical protein
VLSIGHTLGVVGLLAGTAVAAFAQEPVYRAAAGAPVAWQSFARDVQARFEQRLAADDEKARAVQDEIAKRKESPDAASPKFILRTWITPDGKVELDPSNDDRLVAGLRALLNGLQVGVPPADMLQPLQLRMSLRPKDEQARSK